MAEVTFKSDDATLDLSGANPDHPLWLVVYEQYLRNGAGLLIVRPEDCPEPNVIRVTSAECYPSRVYVSETGPHLKLPRF